MSRASSSILVISYQYLTEPACALIWGQEMITMDIYPMSSLLSGAVVSNWHKQYAKLVCAGQPTAMI